ncbi:MAG: carboxylesterase/lipase family protein [Acidimicrobiales bacterium]
MAVTTAGHVAGVVQGSTVAWQGVPYGAPTSGERRFQPPEPPASWDGVRPATAFGFSAPQPMSALQVVEGGSFGEASEDCLYLNVYAPLDRPPEAPLRPVMVWIHGGAFVAGAGSSRWYDGSRFASGGEVVVVTLNYRLGALGFLDLASIAGDRFESSGVCGLLDQLAALRWVQDNIASFGGDPDRVTVFGESAGAMSIGAMLAMPAARGLFRQAILQSGANTSYRTPAEAAEVTEQLLTAFGGSLEQLLAAPAADVIQAQFLMTQGSLTSSYLAFRPAVGGPDLPTPPDDAGALGDGFDGPVLIGTNKNEMSLFMAFDPAMMAMSPDQLDARGAELAGPYPWPSLEQHYRHAYPGEDASLRLYAVATDALFRIPALRLAEHQAASPRGAAHGVWMYRFDWPTPFGDGRLGATHALDIPFVWDLVDLPGITVFTGDSPDRHALARAMHTAWTAFAVSGDPSTQLLAWPRYEDPDRATMVFDAESRVTNDPDGTERRLWMAS